MKKLSLMIVILGFCFTPFSARAEMSEIEGTIVKKVDSKREIYVYDGTEKHEYYFNGETKVFAAGTETDFTSLKEGQKVKVTANKIGKRLDPVKVEMME